MAFKVFAVLLLVTVVGITAKQTCGQFEKFETCGTACEKECKKIVKRCIQVCVPGCFCLPGYIRSGTECIPVDTCRELLHAQNEETCGKNEEYTNCKTECEPTCENPFGPWTCPDDCKQGCICKKDHFRQYDGQCVDLFECQYQ